MLRLYYKILPSDVMTNLILNAISFPIILLLFLTYKNISRYYVNIALAINLKYVLTTKRPPFWRTPL